MSVTNRFIAGRRYPGLPVDTLNFLMSEVRRLGARVDDADLTEEEDDVGPQSCAWVIGRLGISGPIKPGQPLQLKEALFKPAHDATDDPPPEVLEPMAISCIAAEEGKPWGVALGVFELVNAVNRVAVQGSCWAWVDVTDVAHEFCDVVSGGTLASATAGPAKILWAAKNAETTKTGDQWCLILIGGGGSSGGGKGKLGVAIEDIAGATRVAWDSLTTAEKTAIGETCNLENADTAGETVYVYRVNRGKVQPCQRLSRVVDLGGGSFEVNELILPEWESDGGAGYQPVEATWRNSNSQSVAAGKLLQGKEINVPSSATGAEGGGGGQLDADIGVVYIDVESC